MITIVDEDVEKLEHLYTINGNVKWAAMKNNMEVLKKLKIELPYSPAILLGIPKRTEIRMFIAALFIIAKT